MAPSVSAKLPRFRPTDNKLQHHHWPVIVMLTSWNLPMHSTTALSHHHHTNISGGNLHNGERPRVS